MGRMEKVINNYERDWRYELKGYDASLLCDNFLAKQEKKKKPIIFFQN